MQNGVCTLTLNFIGGRDVLRSSSCIILIWGVTYRVRGRDGKLSFDSLIKGSGS